MLLEGLEAMALPLKLETQIHAPREQDRAGRPWVYLDAKSPDLVRKNRVKMTTEKLERHYILFTKAGKVFPTFIFYRTVVKRAKDIPFEFSRRG